jgi:hypothetical protein
MPLILFMADSAATPLCHAIARLFFAFAVFHDYAAISPRFAIFVAMPLPPHCRLTLFFPMPYAACRRDAIQRCRHYFDLTPPFARHYYFRHAAGFSPLDCFD